jgi:hypothetical protein
MAVPISRTISFASSSISKIQNAFFAGVSRALFVSADMLRERSMEGQHPIVPVD